MIDFLTKLLSPEYSIFIYTIISAIGVYAFLKIMEAQAATYNLDADENIVHSTRCQNETEYGLFFRCEIIFTNKRIIYRALYWKKIVFIPYSDIVEVKKMLSYIPGGICIKTKDKTSYKFLISNVKYHINLIYSLMNRQPR